MAATLLLAFAAACATPGPAPEVRSAEAAQAQLDELITFVDQIHAGLDPTMQSWRGRPMLDTDVEDKLERLNSWRRRLPKAKKSLEAALAAYLADPDDEKKRKRLADTAEWAAKLGTLVRPQLR